jgi:hypothetical protein
MSSDQLLDDASLEEAVAAAMDEGKRKGLPDGWKVTIDVRNVKLNEKIVSENYVPKFTSFVAFLNVFVRC